MNEVKKDKSIIYTIFCMGVAYILFLIWAIIWKCGRPFINIDVQRAINLIPFKNNAAWEIGFNIALFIPFGFYLAAIIRKARFLMLTGITALASFAFEAVQFALGVGYSDITDLLTNTLGGIVGIWAYYLISKIFGKNARIVTLVLCVILTLLIIYMTISFIVFGQLYLGFMTIRL